MSRSKGQAYFFNRETHESVWDIPSGLDPDDIKDLPGAELLSGEPLAQVRASHLLVKHDESRRPSSWKQVRVSY